MTSENFRNNPMFLRNQFDTDGIFEMPVIQRQDIDLKNLQLIGYDKTKPNDRTNVKKFVHFFLDDYKFEVIWNEPKPRLEKLSQYEGILSPQFSTYYTMPVSQQIFNTFRSRWCGAYLQSEGLTVIPTVSWGLPQSYWYCFDGIEKGSTVAVSTLGVKKEKDFFLQGYNEMLLRIQPKEVICYCEPFPEMSGKIITVDYAQTNNLEQSKKSGAINPEQFDCLNAEYRSSSSGSGIYVRKFSGYVVTNGMGGGGNNHTKIHIGKQGKHMPTHNNYKEGRSVIYGNSQSIQNLLSEFSGKGQRINENKERVDFGKVIGEYMDPVTGESIKTTVGIIHYSGNGAHIVPARPNTTKGD